MHTTGQTLDSLYRQKVTVFLPQRPQLQGAQCPFFVIRADTQTHALILCVMTEMQ